MGWLDRVHDIVTATGGAIEAPLGFVADTARALPELGTLNLPDFTHDVYHALIDRGGAEVSNLIGPQGVGGSLIGGLPSPVRAGGGAVISPLQDGMDLAYHDLVGKPLATAVTAATFAKSDGLDALLKPKTYAESWNIAEHRSPGQSLALAFLTKDIRDPAQVKKAQGTDWYQVVSGVTDAVSRTLLDPTAIGLGKITEAAKAARAIEGAADIERLTMNGQVAKFADRIGQISAEHGDGAAAVIRHELFPRHQLGSQIADVLANADRLPAGLIDGLSGPAARERVTRILMGAGNEVELLRSSRPDLAGQIDRLMQRQSSLKALSLNGEALATAPEEMANIDRELNSLYSQRARLDRLDATTASLQSLPRTGGAVALRGRFTMGDFYQASPFAKPLHVVTSMEPHPWIHLDDPGSDISIWRMLNKSDLPLEEQLAHRSAYMAANSPAARIAAATTAENAAVASIAETAGMSTDEIHQVLAEASRGRGMTKRALDSRAYDGEGRSVITLDDENGITHKVHVMEYPLYETQLPNLHPVVDLDKVRDAIKPVNKFLNRVPGHEVAPEMLNAISSVWKPLVLLRVGFPVRFVTDEAMRSIAKIGALSTMKNIGRGGADAVGSVLEKAGFASREMETLGPRLGGHQFESAFSTGSDGGEIYKKLIQAREAFGTLVSADEGKTMEQLIQSGPWRSIDPANARDAIAYPKAWEHAVNNQIGKSALGAKLLERMALEAPSQRLEEFASPALREAFATPRAGSPLRVEDITPGGLYHGSSRDFSSFGHAVSPGTPTNLYGPGVYYTDNPNVALNYTRKGAKGAVGEQGVVHRIETGHLNMLDATAAAPAPVRSAFARYLEEQRGFPAGEAASVTAEGVTTDAMYRTLKSHFRDEGMTVTEANEHLDAITANLENLGYDGIKYAGGTRTGGEAHNAYVVFDPAKVQIAESFRPGTATRAVPATTEDTIAHVADWLRNDPAGQKIAESLPVRKDLESWVRAAHDQIDAYLPSNELKAGAWQGTASHDELAKLIPNASNRPIVHGGVIGEQMGGPLAKTGAAYRKIIDTAMQNVVGKPSNVLIRNPFFDHMYQAELARQVGVLTGEQQLSLPQRMAAFVRGESTHATGNVVDLTADDLTRMEVRARRYAQTQTKDLFHNFAEEFSFAKQLGFLAPFSNAWGQITSRWAGIAIDNPAFVRRMQIVWRAPDRAGLVTDGSGNVLDEHGNIATPVKGGAFKVGDAAADGERFVTLHLPTWARDIPGLRQVGDLKFGKDSLNLIMHGLPAVGPLVQIPINEIAKSRPELEGSLKWALPFGVTQDSLDILKPTLVRRFQTVSEGDANRSYAYTAMRIYTDKMVDYNLGKRAKPPTWTEAKDDANAFWHVRTIASFVLPAAPQFTSPYQPYIDAYRARRDLDAKLTAPQKQLPTYKTPDEWFLDTYGQEFFPLVASMSKSIDGIPPTLAGQKVHDQMSKLVGQYPELGSLITGAEGAGAFSRAVYEAQFGQKIGPGSTLTERRPQTYEEFGQQASTKLGWIEFGRVMDRLDSVLHQRGLASYSVRAASDLQAAKQAVIGVLATDPRYAGWYTDYASTDSTKWDHRIAGMTAIVGDPKLIARPEFQGLKQYLEGRAAITTALDRLGKKNLHTQANAALAAGWETYVQQLVDTNPAFGALYNRWLQNDPVVVTPITLQAQSGALPLAGV